MVTLQLLVLILRIQVAGLTCATDYQCELAEQAYAQMAVGDIAEAEITIELLDLDMED